MNIGALLPRHARYRPDHLALVVGDQRLTYQKLNAVVNRLANALLANGITKGEKIATVLPNCLELMTAYWAAAKTGIVIVPMSTLLQEGGLATLLRDSDWSPCSPRRPSPKPWTGFAASCRQYGPTASCWWALKGRRRQVSAPMRTSPPGPPKIIPRIPA